MTSSSASEDTAVTTERGLRAVHRHLSWRRRWASVTLWLEKLTAAAAPVAAILALFIACSLVGIWAAVPAWLHVIGLAFFAAGLIALVVHAVRGFAPPTSGDGDRRLESATDLRHQPLQMLQDRPVSSDPVSQQLWNAQARRAREAVGSVPLVGVRPVLSSLDPWAFRAGLVLLLVVAGVDAGDQWRDRLIRAFVPQAAMAAESQPPRADLWVTPPLYTGQAPIVESVDFETASERALVVPHGSELVIQVHGLEPEAVPTVRFAGELLATRDLGPGSLEVRQTVTHSGGVELAVPGGAGTALIGLEVIADQLPEVAFLGAPTVSVRGSLQPAFEARDDYGVLGVDLELRLPNRPADDPEIFSLRTLSSARPELTGTSFLDLTPHPFAGLEVTATLLATDEAGQVGRSDTIRFVLPEREFTHPLARAIAAARKIFMGEPERRDETATVLNTLAQSKRAEAEGAAVPLTLRSAATRLNLHRDGGADRETAQMLWDLAVFLEDGNLATAERDLRELQEALRDALERGADEAEIDRLMDELERAMAEFMQALQEQMQQAMQDPNRAPQQFQPLDPSAQVLRPQDLQNMMDSLRDSLKSGSREQAEQMLSQLQRMLENMRMAMQMPMSQQQQQLGILQEMIRRQQGLMDDAFDMQRQQGQQGQPQAGQMPNQQPGQMPGQNPGQSPGPGQGQQMPGGTPQDLAQDQEVLRRALGELMRQLGESGDGIPRALGQAELQMRSAEQSLNQGQPGQATGPQGNAVDLLQQGAGQLMEQMQQQMGQQPGPYPGQQQSGMGPPLTSTRDPLGRPLRNDGGASSFGVEVPDDADLGTARDVLRELHKRAGERGRPPIELDYFDRLLKRF